MSAGLRIERVASNTVDDGLEVMLDPAYADRLPMSALDLAPCDLGVGIGGLNLAVCAVEEHLGGSLLRAVRHVQSSFLRHSAAPGLYREGSATPGGRKALISMRRYTFETAKGDCVRLLATRAARGIILFGSVLVVSELKLPQGVGVAVIIAIQAGLYWYALSLLQRKR